MSYDSKCHDLAEHFLTGDGRSLAVVDPTGRRIKDLAQRIQTSVEDWFDEEAWSEPVNWRSAAAPE